MKLVDDMAELANLDGHVSVEHRERLRIACLASCVLGWEITEDGQPVPFTQKNVIRLLSAAKWVQAQVDAFASDRAGFREPR